MFSKIGNKIGLRKLFIVAQQRPKRVIHYYPYLLRHDSEHLFANRNQSTNQTLILYFYSPNRSLQFLFTIDLRSICPFLQHLQFHHPFLPLTSLLVCVRFRQSVLCRSSYPKFKDLFISIVIQVNFFYVLIYLYVQNHIRISEYTLNFTHLIVICYLSLFL